jgi:hypothetical protein
LIFLEVYLEVSVLEQSPLLHFCELLAGEVLLVGDEGFEVRHE